MYTIDDEKEDLYEDDDYDTNWNNRRGLIFKIIIIILCIIVLIWLIKALKSNSGKSDNGSVHVANTEKIRLAAEEYFFLKNNKDKASYITLTELKSMGLIGDVVDANNKVCSDSGTKVNLDKEIDSYKMTINFSCSTNDKNEVFYYHRNTLACLNCSGKTYMDGKAVVIDDDTKDHEKDNNNSNEEESEYSCINWSEWTKTRVSDITLTERKKVLVQGVKYGKKNVYGEWTEYTTTPVEPTNELEVETKVVSEEVWSDPKTDTNIDTGNSNIRIISTETITTSSNNCTDGYVEDNICYSNKVKVSNLTFTEYNSGKYKVKKQYCDGVKTLKDKNGLYVLTYLNCEYNEKIGKAKKSSSYTLYTYQELEKRDVTYYRSRTITEVNEPDKYTDIKYEEAYLPSGYVKVAGSEETYYSYKIATCEK